jgi:hypothetical protein
MIEGFTKISRQISTHTTENLLFNRYNMTGADSIWFVQLLGKFTMEKMALFGALN